MKLFYTFIILLVVATTGFSVTNNSKETGTYSVEQVLDQKTFVELLRKGEPFDVLLSNGEIIEVFVDKNPLLIKKAKGSKLVLSEETDLDHKAALIENNWLKDRNDFLRDKIRELMKEKEEWEKQKEVLLTQTDNRRKVSDVTSTESCVLDQDVCETDRPSDQNSTTIKESFVGSSQPQNNVTVYRNTREIKIVSNEPCSVTVVDGDNKEDPSPNQTKKPVEGSNGIILARADSSMNTFR